MQTILVIDDNNMQHELLRCYAMNLDGFNFIHAVTLEDGLAQIKSHKPVLIFLDNRLAPYEDFVQTAPSIRAKGFTGPLVVISSDIHQPIFRQAKEYKVDHVIDKSQITLDNFGDVISHYL